MLKLFVYYLILINACGITVMYVDKKNAQHRTSRVPERTLWQDALLGGAMKNVTEPRLKRLDWLEELVYGMVVQLVVAY